MNVPPDTIKSKEIQTLIQHMIKVMRDYSCVGLACNQIGMPLRIVTMEFKESLKKEYSPKVYEIKEMQSLPLTVLINPVLQPKDFTKVSFVESCASVKGIKCVFVTNAKNQFLSLGFRIFCRGCSL